MTGIIGELRDFWNQMNALARVGIIGMIMLASVPAYLFISTIHQPIPNFSYYSYTVLPGETLSGIAVREKAKMVRNCSFDGRTSDVTVTIQMRNSMSTDQVHAGQQLWLPTC
jgi:hypothetical protein